jgi:hypothetical protein
MGEAAFTAWRAVALTLSRAPCTATAGRGHKHSTSTAHKHCFLSCPAGLAALPCCIPTRTPAGPPPSRLPTLRQPCQHAPHELQSPWLVAGLTSWTPPVCAVSRASNTNGDVTRSSSCWVSKSAEANDAQRLPALQPLVAVVVLGLAFLTLLDFASRLFNEAYWLLAPALDLEDASILRPWPDECAADWRAQRRGVSLYASSKNDAAWTRPCAHHCGT